MDLSTKDPERPKRRKRPRGGEDRQRDLFTGIRVYVPPPKLGNPVVAAYGPDPDGRQCQDCANLVRDVHGAGEYFRCTLRRHTRGAGSDHRATWPACARFVGREDPPS